jgi:hypothetical protein
MERCFGISSFSVSGTILLQVLKFQDEPINTKYRGDLITAALTKSRTLFELPALHPLTPTADPNNNGSELGGRPTLDLSCFRDEVNNSLRTVLHLAERCDDIVNSNGAITAELEMFHRTSFPAEHRLLFAKTTMPVQSSNYHVKIHVYQACRVAGFICLSYNFWSLRKGNDLFTSLLYSLDKILSHIESFKEEVNDMLSMAALLWVCSVGELVAVDKILFTQRVRYYVSVLEYQSQSEVQNCLKQFVWTRKMNEQYSADWLVVA